MDRREGQRFESEVEGKSDLLECFRSIMAIEQGSQTPEDGLETRVAPYRGFANDRSPLYIKVYQSGDLPGGGKLIRPARLFELVYQRTDDEGIKCFILARGKDAAGKDCTTRLYPIGIDLAVELTKRAFEVSQNN